MQHIFKHELIPYIEIQAETSPTGRLYNTPVGEFPSVTTMLGAVKDNSGLIQWREAVGDIEADKVTARSARRGTALHNMCEKYVLNDPTYSKGVMPSVLELFNQIKPVLESRLSVVYANEIPLYSKYLRLAGRCDLIGRFDGKRSIIDYKTTNWAKDDMMMESYFVQETCYAIMFEEMYGIPITQLVTISAGESEPSAQVIIKHRDDYADLAVQYIKTFYEKKLEMDVH